MNDDPTKIVSDSAKPPAAGNGRPKGALNKTTKAAKEAIAYAAEGLGGADRIVEWAKEDAKNEAAFWTTIYPRLLPLQVGGDPDNPIKYADVTEDAERVAAMINDLAHRSIDGPTLQ